MMRSIASLVSIAMVSMLCACGDEAAPVRGSWNIDRWTAGRVTNLQCDGVVPVEATAAGTMVFDDVPHPEGIADHTFTYTLNKFFQQTAFVDTNPPFTGVAGWEPDTIAPSEKAGFSVSDPLNTTVGMGGDWLILESGVGTLHLQHLFGEDEGGGAVACTAHNFFLAAQ